MRQVGYFCRKMNQYFAQTGQRELTEDGEFVRSIYESIVLKIRHYAEALKELGIIYGRINIINWCSAKISLSDADDQ